MCCSINGNNGYCCLLFVVFVVTVLVVVVVVVVVVGERAEKHELGRMLQLVLGCAVNCDDKHEYIQRIMGMEEVVQHDVMKAIQEVYCYINQTLE